MSLNYVSTYFNYLELNFIYLIMLTLFRNYNSSAKISNISTSSWVNFSIQLYNSRHSFSFLYMNYTTSVEIPGKPS